MCPNFHFWIDFENFLFFEIFMNPATAGLKFLDVVQDPRPYGVFGVRSVILTIENTAQGGGRTCTWMYSSGRVVGPVHYIV